MEGFTYDAQEDVEQHMWQASPLKYPNCHVKVNSYVVISQCRFTALRWHGWGPLRCWMFASHAKAPLARHSRKTNDFIHSLCHSLRSGTLWHRIPRSFVVPSRPCLSSSASTLHEVTFLPSHCGQPYRPLPIELISWKLYMSLQYSVDRLNAAVHFVRRWPLLLSMSEVLVRVLSRW